MLTLYPHQELGVKYIRARPHVAFLAFECRCGKSASALCALPPAFNPAPVLVIGPKTSLGVWRAQAGMWRPDYRFETIKKFRWPRPGEILATNYERAVPEGVPYPGTILICDEAQALKTPSAYRTKCCRIIANACLRAGGRLWLLSGTPICRDPEDLWSLLEFGQLTYQSFRDRQTFVRCFSGTPLGNGKYHWGIPLPEASQRLKKAMLYKRKADVLPWLPKIECEDLVVELDDERTRVLCDRFAETLAERGLTYASVVEKGIDEPGKLIFELRSALAVAKTPAMLELVELAGEQGEKTLVFSAHRAPIDILAKRKGWGVITGSTSEKKRAKCCEDWHSGKLLGVALTIRAGGLSIDLSGTDQVIFVDREWNPGANRQGFERCSGPGQTKPVLVRYLVADHVVDQTVNSILAMKERVIEGTFGPL